MQIICYPNFIPLSLDLQDEMQELLSNAVDGVSEYTFSNLYLFRKRYTYKVSRAGGSLILSGERDGKTFFATPAGLPEKDILSDLFASHDYWKGLPESLLPGAKDFCDEIGAVISEDRDNFDYLYNSSDLAELSGKKFHKKRNLVNAFLNSYVPEVLPLTLDRVPDALKTLEQWHLDKENDGDYVASKEALELFDKLTLSGAIYYINGRPVGWCMGEPLAKNTMYAVHFEKGLDEYKGLYQYINQNFAASLAENFSLINREQDLGDEGLRQSKMTYRPVGFVKKHVVLRT